MDKLCHTNGHEDFTTIFYNAIQWAKNKDFSISTDAPDSVHIAVTENIENRYKTVVSAINLTSSPKRPVKQLYPVGNINIDVTLKGSDLKEYKVLRKEGNVNITVLEKKNDEIIVRIFIEKLDEFASVYFETQR